MNEARLYELAHEALLTRWGRSYDDVRKYWKVYFYDYFRDIRYYEKSTNWEVVKLLKKTLDRSIKIRKKENIQ